MPKLPRFDILSTINKATAPIRRAVDPVERWDHKYYQAYDKLKQYPEANTQTPGRQLMRQNLRDTALWNAAPYDLTVPHGTSWSAAQAHRRGEYLRAAKRKEILYPWVERYTQLREEGLTHNSALDTILSEAESLPPDELYLIQSTFDKMYDGNRSAFSDLADPVEPTQLSQKGADISRTIRNSAPGYAWGRRQPWSTKSEDY